MYPNFAYDDDGAVVIIATLPQNSSFRGGVVCCVAPKRFNSEQTK